jgi:energy-coupling factor transporter ATP-binding protein EcfA2
MILEDITNWVNTLPYWQRQISYNLLHTINFDDKISEKIYESFKIENEMIDGEIDSNFKLEQIQTGTQADDKILWKGVGDVEGINALSSNQRLSIGPQLTIIYGKNGSGKSGYSRIFNNVFVSRGDKSLLPNIYSEEPEKQKAKLIFEVDGLDKEIIFPQDINDYSYGRKISVFDSISALGDMTKENELSLAPIEFSFFDNLAREILKIKDKFDYEKSIKNNKNNFLSYFSEDTDIKKVISQIDFATDINVLKKQWLISQEEQKLLTKNIERKKVLEGLNIDTRLKKIDNLLGDIDSFKLDLEKLNLKISVDRLIKVKKLIEEKNQLLIVSSKEGLKQFENNQIENLGSAEWKSFIEASKKYYDSIVNDGEELDYCILCKQELSKNELMEKYWAYLRSEATTKLEKVNDNIKKILIDFTSLKNIEIINPKSRLYEYLNENTSLLAKISKFEESLKKQIDIVINNLKTSCWNLDVSSISFSVEPLDSVSKELENEREKMDSTKVNIELEAIQTFINQHNAKLQANTLLPQIESYIEELAWLEKANKCSISTSLITRKQKELFSKYVTKEYVKRFEFECKLLQIERDIELVQRGAIGTTRNKLNIKGKNPNEVLSEGEQRSAALANFLAETQSFEENICVIFDDPVSSLDYERRDVIAERLAILAREKQVVVLTHDLSFMRVLEDFAEREKIDKVFQHIQKLPNGKVGLINDISPWIVMKVKARLGYLRNELQQMTANFKQCENPEEFEDYKRDAKIWCENLRETWERVIEETLLCGAIERFSPAIKTQSLKKATFTNQLYDEIEAGMRECSNWVHDRTVRLGDDIPKPEELKNYLDRCTIFVTENKPN